VKAGLLLSRPIKRLEFFRFSSCSCVGFSYTSARCSLKCALDFELFIGSFLVVIVSHVSLPL
jgi:hypothetical protein